MQRIFNILLLWIVASVATAYADDIKDNVLPVQEKVYLQFDNNCYFLGDTIWYKAYVVLADDNSPQPLSRILYVELLDEQGYVMERQQLVVDENGQANGQFAICDTTFAGYYEIRAYTKWMLNFGFDSVESWYTKTWDGTNETGLKAYDPTSYTAYKQAEATNKTQLKPGEIKITRNEQIADLPEDNEYENAYNVMKDGMWKNYRDYYNLFSRVIPVYSRPDSAQNYMRKIMPTKITMGDYEVRWSTKDFDVKFYPEGGALLEGCECRVAWEAMNEELERLNVSGLLLEDGEPLDSIKPLHAGRGVFTLTPKHGKSYKVRFQFGDNKFSFDLPDALKEGARLWVEQDEEGAYFTVDKHFQTKPNLTLALYCRGKRTATYKVEGDSTWQQACYLDDLPEGVNQAVVHDDDGNVYADRLFFVNKSYESKAKVMVAGIANRAYQPLEKIRLNLLATDAKGRPLKDQTFSVSVRDADQLDPTFATGNIMTNLLLESEIKGFVENPDYYFESNDEKHRQALDLLLMIQGWRRYDWKQIDHPETARLDYLPEQKMVVYGQAIPLRRSLFSKDVGLLQITCALINRNDYLKEGDTFKFKGVCRADSAGKFSFAYDPFYGNVKLRLCAKFVKKLDRKNYDLISSDNKIFIRKEYFFPQTEKAYSWYETSSPETSKGKKLTWEDLQDDIYASEWIPQVNIKSKKRPHAKRQKDKPVLEMDFLDFINDKWDQGYYDAFYLFDNKEIPIAKSWELLHGWVRGEYDPGISNNETHMESYNWETAPNGNFDFLPILDKISIISDAPRRPTPYAHYHLDRRTGTNESYGIDSYINITTFSNDSTRITVGREYNFHGFDRPIEYYNPDYSKAKLPEIKDYRRTLYWNPKVTTDAYGQASIEFYNNSVCKQIDIDAEGVSKYGQFITTEE